MTDAATLSALKQASVFIRGPDISGSGWLVAPRRIGTAHHVVESWQPGRRYEVQVGVDSRRPVEAWLIDADPAADVALLGFDDGVAAEPLPLAVDLPPVDATWLAYGYPAVANRLHEAPPHGLPLGGKVRDPQARGRLLLDSPEIAAGTASPLHGFSGSPVLVDGRVVGHLVRHVGDIDDAARPAFGYVYACPAAALQALLDADEATSAGQSLGPRDALKAASYRDPDALYLLVVTPPGAAAPGTLALGEQAQLAWEQFRPEIAAAVKRLREGMNLRPMPNAAVNGGFVVVDLRVDEALASPEALAAACRALCRCEAALFDLTGDDAGVLFLLGIRSVARRGVTLTSIGADYTLGSEHLLPFNLQLLNMGAHSKAQLKMGKGERPHELIGDKLVAGFRQLADLPHYLDLPAYDSVRQLGIDSEAHKPIRYTEKVLLLCPFARAYSERNWELHFGLALAGKLMQRAREAVPPVESNVRVERLLEASTPRLVAQSLYESIRRVDLCIIDWSGCRPNVMFEAGVRLATNALGAVHVIDDDAASVLQMREPPAHVRTLLAMLNPIHYRCEPGKMPFDEMIRRFDTSVRDYGAGVRGFVFDAVGGAVDLAAQSSALPLVDELVRAANLLASEDAQSVGIPPVLFSEVNPALAERAAGAAADRRLAAWLFLSHRHAPCDIARDHRLLETFQLLTAQVRRWARAQGRTELFEQITAFRERVVAASHEPGDSSK